MKLNFELIECTDNGATLSDYGLPMPINPPNYTQAEPDDLDAVYVQQHNMLSNEQSNVFDEIDNNENDIVFLDASAGTGKTYVLNTYIAKYGIKKIIAISYSGVASSLLYGGQTAHSLLKIPLLCYDYSTTCRIKANDDAAKRIQQARSFLRH